MQRVFKQAEGDPGLGLRKHAAAAQMVAESDREGVAAISSKICADLYGLSVLSEQMQKQRQQLHPGLSASRRK